MLRVKNISYQTSGKVILENVSAAFLPGRLNLVIGPNGAGKSTLIKVICNQLKPTQGDIFYSQKNLKEIGIEELAKKRSVLSQNVELAFPLMVREVVMMGRYPHFTGKPAARDEAAVEEAMRFFDVSHLSERNCLTLSGGEKQRVQFARVLSQIWYPYQDETRFLILDEPLTFLDVHYQFDFMHKVIHLLSSQDIVVIGVVHDLNLAAKFGDHILLLLDGKVLSAGNRNKVLSAQNIQTAYHLEPIIHKQDDEMHIFFR